MSASAQTAAPGSALSHTPVADLTFHILWRLLVIVFLVSTGSEWLFNRFDLKSDVLVALATGLLVTSLTLPLLFQFVIRPAVRIIFEQTAAGAETTLQAILQAVGDGVVLSQLTGRILYANRAAEKMLGYSPSGLTGRQIQELTTPEYRETQAAEIAAFLAGDPCAILNQGPREVMSLRSNGDLFPIELTWNSLQSAGLSREPLFVAIIREITARKRTEAALRESEALFHTLADTAPALIWMAKPDGCLNFLNKGWLDFRGRTLEQELDMGWAEGLHPEDYSRCLEAYESAVSTQEPYEMEYRVRRHDGEYRWLLDRGVPRWNPDGTFAGFIGICMDVTLRKQAEDTLRASEQRFRDLLEALPVAVRIAQGNHLVFANTADARLHGYETPAEEIGLDLATQFPAEELSRVQELARRREAGEYVPPRFETRRLRRDGSEFLAEVEADRILFNGRPASLVAIRDLTERKRIEIYEKLLPVCCVCGKIRDDDGVDPGCGGWKRLDQYLSRHSDAEFSHTFCPECFVDYRRKNLPGN